LRAVLLRIQLMSVRPVSGLRQTRLRFLLSFLLTSTPVAARISVCSSGSSHVDDSVITQISRSAARSSLYFIILRTQYIHITHNSASAAQLIHSEDEKTVNEPVEGNDVCGTADDVCWSTTPPRSSLATILP